MTYWEVLGLIVGVLILLLIVLLAIYGSLDLAQRLREARGVTMTLVAEDRIELRTPAGPADARIVVHEFRGRCYEVRTHFRGEPTNLIYVPPAPLMVRNEVERRVAANQQQRQSPQRRIAS